MKTIMLSILMLILSKGFSVSSTRGIFQVSRYEEPTLWPVVRKVRDGLYGPDFWTISSWLTLLVPVIRIKAGQMPTWI